MGAATASDGGGRAPIILIILGKNYDVMHKILKEAFVSVKCLVTWSTHAQMPKFAANP